MSKDYYKILQISPNASQQGIKEAYKQLALKYHPDKNSYNKQEAKQRFTALAQAYDVLSNPKKRQEYDSRPKSTSSKNSSHSRSFQKKQDWKNPQFQPSFDHFANLPEDIKKNGLKKMNQHLHFYNLSDFYIDDMLNEQFGSFSFQKAERIFEKVFNKNKNFLGLTASNQSQKLSNCISNQIARKVDNAEPALFKKSLQSYQPKNSTLIQQKIVERNGKKIKVKKYSITENGETHRETHQVIFD